MVTTALGPIAPDALGLTLMHEHLIHDLGRRGELLDDPLRDQPVTTSIVDELAGRPFSSVDNAVFEDEDLLAHELAALRRAGGRTVVEMTVDEFGRDAAALRRLAQATGINVVVATGHYVAALLPPTLDDQTIEAIAERMVADLVEGIGDTGVRAGMLKVGTSAPLTPVERRVLAAAAAAQAATAAPITVHLSNLGQPVSNGHDVLTVLEAAGADLTRVILAHLDLTLAGEPDLSHHRELLRRGCTIGYDTCGHAGTIELPGGRRVDYPSDTARARALATLLEDGYGGSLVISNDICTKIRLTTFGGSGYAHVLKGFRDELADAGVGAADLQRLLIDNPRRLLAA